jgi:hypothetical protein
MTTSHSPPPLPGGDQSGHEAEWYLPTTTVDDPDVTSGTLTLRARFLGVGSTRFDRHTGHAGRFVAPEGRCGACRWFETRIFRVGLNDYVLHHTGVSRVPGEVDLHRHQRVYSPHEVLEAYTVRRAAEGRAFLTRPAARALAQAVAFDPDLRDAYETRAVV